MFLITLQRYDTIFIYPNELTLINIILYLYTFSLTHTYARTLYKTKHRQTDGCTSTDKRHIYVCILVCRQSSLPHQAGKRHPKAEKQNKPIHGTKIFKGRVAPPPFGDASLWVYPTSKFFYFFCIVCVRCFFLKFFIFLFLLVIC